MCTVFSLSALRGIAVATAFALGSAAAEAAPTEVTIRRIEAAPTLRDFSDATARSQGMALQMTRVEGFTTRLPQDGLPLSERTEAYLGYDDAAIHAVFVCFDRNPDLVAAHLSSRDRISGADDSVAFQIDTFRDLAHAYGFQVNPLGVQTDGIFTEGKGWDLSFDTVWKSEGQRTAEGYVVIVSIPFRSLRFPPGDSKTFGLFLYRGIPRTNEEAFWPVYTQRIAGRMNQAAVVSGLDGVTAGRNRQFIPYTSARSFRTLDPGSTRPRTYHSDSFDASFGGDAKIVLGGSMSLDLTANPDFSQVESDDPQVTVNQRFEVFFPEKRPFFLENASYFDTPIPLFFSRRVQDPDLGARLTGRQGAYAIGAVVARDRATGTNMANVLRVNRDLGPTAAAGVFGSTRSLPSGRNSVTGIDGRLRFGAWSASAQAAGSFSRTPQAPDRSGFATRATLLRTGRAFNYSGEYSERSSDFASVLGYIDRVDFRRTDHRASHRFFKENSTFIDWGPDLAVSVVRDRQGRALEHQARASLMLEWSRQTQVSFYRQDAAARLRRSEFPLFDPLVEISPSYSQDGWGATFHSTPINGIEVTLGASRLDGINLVPAPGKAEGAARDASWNAQIDLRPTARLGLVVSGIETRLDTPGGDAIFVNRILRTKAQFQFSRALSARVILQYDALDAAPARTRLQSGRRFNADFLATFLPSPGTAIYAGFNNNAIDLDHALQSDRAGLAIPRGGFLSDGRQFFVKVSYLLRR